MEARDALQSFGDGFSCSFYLAPGCQNNNALENEFIPSSELPACATRRCKTTPAAGETPERVFPEGSTSCPGPTDDARMRSCLERTSGSGLGQIRLLFTQCWIIREVPQPPRPAELTPGVAPPGLHFAGQSTETRGYLSGEIFFFLPSGRGEGKSELGTGGSSSTGLPAALLAARG